MSCLIIFSFPAGQSFSDLWGEGGVVLFVSCSLLGYKCFSSFPPILDFAFKILYGNLFKCISFTCPCFLSMKFHFLHCAALLDC